jgi:glutamine amidotransferase
VGDTLTYRVEPDGSTVVASEPTDDEPGWRDVPDRSLLLASNGEVLLTLL